MTTASRKERNASCNAGDHGCLSRASACVPDVRAALRSNREPIPALLRGHPALPCRGIRGVATYATTTTAFAARVRVLCVAVCFRPHTRPAGEDTVWMSGELPLDLRGVHSRDCIPVPRDV